MNTVLAADGLGKRYGQQWALRDCTLRVPAHSVVGLVGPNGAGKTTLLQIIVGLLEPSVGRVEVFGAPPADTPAYLAQISFVAQHNPLYASMTVGEHLRLGAWLNPGWDAELAERRVSDLGLARKQRAGKLSGGEHAQLALTMALAKRPQLLVLDEPVASLDPLARHEFLQRVMEAAAERQVTVILSSHLLADLERICDYLIVMAHARVQVAGEVDELLACHHRLTGPRRPTDNLPGEHQVIEASHTDRQSSYLIRTDAPILDPAWTVEPVGLESLALAYMRRSSEDERGVGSRLGAVG